MTKNAHAVRKTLADLGLAGVEEIATALQSGLSKDQTVERLGFHHKSVDIVMRKIDPANLEADDAKIMERRRLLSAIIGDAPLASVARKMGRSRVFLERIVNYPERHSPDILGRQLPEALAKLYPLQKNAIQEFVAVCLEARSGPTVSEIKNRTFRADHPTHYSVNTGAKSAKEIREEASRLLTTWREACGLTGGDIQRKVALPVNLARFETAKATLDDRGYLNTARQLCQLYAAHNTAIAPSYANRLNALLPDLQFRAPT